jgi:hypothetical protein
MTKVLEYAKAVVAAVGVVVMVVVAALGDQAVSLDEAKGIWLAVLGVLTAIGVYAAPNKPAT